MGTKMKVSERALIARLNRAMKDEDRMVKKSRGARMLLDCGGYYVLNFRRNWVDFKNVDLEALGREYEVLAAWEVLA